jgi:internalin A
VQGGRGAQLDLERLPHLSTLEGEWAIFQDTIASVAALDKFTTWGFSEGDLHALGGNPTLASLRLEESSRLQSLTGIEHLSDLTHLAILGAPVLDDIEAIRHMGSSLRELELESCPNVATLDDVELLHRLEFLGVSDCRDIESLRPLEALASLTEFFAWGSTRIVDGDLTPLLRLPNLREVRMRARTQYNPSVKDVQRFLAAATE